VTQSFAPPRPERVVTAQVGAAAPKRLTVLGATGSIGRSCARVVAEAPGRFAVVAVAGGRNGAALAHSALELGASFAALGRALEHVDLNGWKIIFINRFFTIMFNGLVG